MAWHRILVVEDEPVRQMIMEDILSDAGYVVDIAGNGEEALAHLQQAAPDLVLSDINMPVMDGYEFYRRLRAIPALELLPFIFVTARDAPQEVLLGKSLGVEDYLTKPFDAEELLVVVEAKLMRARGIRQAVQQEAGVLKQRIVTLLNHELRTPLSVIKGYIEMVVRSGDDLDAATISEYLNSVSEGANRLTALVEDLLELIEIESGAAAQVFARRKDVVYELDIVVQSVAEAYALRAQQAGIKLGTQIQPGLPPVEAEIDMLTNALRRLLDNAIKFSPGGGMVMVSVGTQDGAVAISIGDRGRGIPPDQLDTIFDAFHQAGRKTYEQSGAGLGLPIARAIIELHGGHIEAKSQEGAGSVFSIVLPTIEPPTLP